jgi:hypothetical protein
MNAPHRTDDVKKPGQPLNIELHYIPVGATDMLRPLNPVTFGHLKSRAKRPFMCWVERHWGALRTKARAVQEVMQTLEKLTEGVVRED